MSLTLLLDEDSQAKYLINLLQAAGHDILTVNVLGIAGISDAKVLDYCRQLNRILLTRNCNDFHVLHQINSLHPGILAIYQDSEIGKNMSYQSIVKAINNIEIAEVDIKNQFIILNQWQF